jgi:phosphopantetheine adenylyltransferase
VIKKTAKSTSRKWPGHRCTTGTVPRRPWTRAGLDERKRRHPVFENNFAADFAVIGDVCIDIYKTVNNAGILVKEHESLGYAGSVAESLVAGGNTCVLVAAIPNNRYCNLFSPFLNKLASVYGGVHWKTAVANPYMEKHYVVSTSGVLKAKYTADCADITNHNNIYTVPIDYMTLENKTRAQAVGVLVLSQGYSGQSKSCLDNGWLAFTKSRYSTDGIPVVCNIRRIPTNMRTDEFNTGKIDVLIMSRKDILAVQCANDVAPLSHVSAMLQPTYIVVTDDKNGITAYCDGKPHYISGIPVVENDATGAGDVVTAVIAKRILELRKVGKTLTDEYFVSACRIANEVAAAAVTRPGVCRLSPSDYEAAVQKYAPVKKVPSMLTHTLRVSYTKPTRFVNFDAGRCTNRAMVIGAFEQIHLGHAQLLAYASSLRDVVIAINSDKSVEINRGRPSIHDSCYRANMLWRILGAAQIVEFDTPTAAEVIRAARPTQIIKGAEYGPGGTQTMPADELDAAAEVGATIIFLGGTYNIHSSDLIKKIKAMPDSADSVKMP